MKTRTKANVARALSIGIFLLSLPQRSYCLNGLCKNELYGFGLVAVGWFGVFFDPLASYSWIANPLLIMAWIEMHKNQFVSFVLSLFSTALCLSFLSVRIMLTSESGEHGTVTGYQAGYWLWLSSSAFFLVGNLYTYLEARFCAETDFFPGIYLGEESQKSRNG